MGTPGNDGRGLDPPYPPPYPTSSSSHPQSPMGSTPFVDPDRSRGASGPPPAGFVEPASSAGGYPPTMGPSTDYYPRSGVYPHRTPSLAMPMPGTSPLPLMPVAPPLTARSAPPCLEGRLYRTGHPLCPRCRCR
ncbi:hypothetical protein MTO96_021015 [Rhipicephalus appendiculatus]